jgi:hypothetical protein
MEEEKKEYDKWKSDKTSWSRKVASSINAWHLIGFFLLVVGGSWAMTSGKIKPSFFYVSLVLAIVVIIFMAYKGPAGKRLIPEHIIKQIVQEALENKRRIGIEIPFDAEVRVMLQGEPKWEQDLTNDTSGMTRRNVGFEVSKKGYRKKGICGVSPFSGEIMGFEFLSTGYTGRESRETVKIVPVGTFETKNPTQYGV